MTAIVPSYLAKLARAEKHLVDLKAEIGRYASTKPYTVRDRIEGKKQRKTYRLAFTTDPANTDIPILAADAIYNLRSGLDHLMSALVAKKDRNSAMFPIYFQGVWDVAPPGENEQRIKDRARWASDTRTVKSDAIAVLKKLQPADDARNVDEPSVLRLINRFSNRDRHEKLPVVATGLSEVLVGWKLPDGTPQAGYAVLDTARSFLKNNANLRVPDGAMDVQVKGVPVVAIGVGDDELGVTRHLELPGGLEHAARYIRNEVIPKLAPYVRI